MFKEELKLVPHLPGSYQMYNKDNIIIYVGNIKLYIIILRRIKMKVGETAYYVPGKFDIKMKNEIRETTIDAITVASDFPPRSIGSIDSIIA